MGLRVQVWGRVWVLWKGSCKHLGASWGPGRPPGALREPPEPAWHFWGRLPEPPERPGPLRRVFARPVRALRQASGTFRQPPGAIRESFWGVSCLRSHPRSVLVGFGARFGPVLDASWGRFGPFGVPFAVFLGLSWVCRGAPVGLPRGSGQPPSEASARHLRPNGENV